MQILQVNPNVFRTFSLLLCENSTIKRFCSLTSSNNAFYRTIELKLCSIDHFARDSFYKIFCYPEAPPIYNSSHLRGTACIRHVPRCRTIRLGQEHLYPDTMRAEHSNSLRLLQWRSSHGTIRWKKERKKKKRWWSLLLPCVQSHESGGCLKRKNAMERRGYRFACCLENRTKVTFAPLYRCHGRQIAVVAKSRTVNRKASRERVF